MSDSKIYIHVSCEVKPGTDVKAIFAPICEQTQKEPGCIQYEVFKQENNNPDGLKYSLIECWRSQKDLDEHMKMPYVQGFAAKNKEHLTGPMNMMIFKQRVA